MVRKEIERTIRRGINVRVEGVKKKIQQRIERPEEYRRESRESRIRELQAENRELKARAEKLRLQRELAQRPRPSPGHAPSRRRAAMPMNRDGRGRYTPRVRPQAVPAERYGVPNVTGFRVW